MHRTESFLISSWNTARIWGILVVANYGILSIIVPGVICLSVGTDCLTFFDREHLKVHLKRRSTRTTYSSKRMQQWPNLIRNIVPNAANQIWVSDITYIDTGNGFAYLHLVTDAYSKKILGWCLSPTLHTPMTPLRLSRWRYEMQDVKLMDSFITLTVDVSTDVRSM